MSFLSELTEEPSTKSLCCVRTVGVCMGASGNAHISSSNSLQFDKNAKLKISTLEVFLHSAPVRCIETVACFLDLSSFLALLTCNSSLVQLGNSAAFASCWTHFAVSQRVLRHGQHVLLPLLYQTEKSLTSEKKHKANYDDKVNPWLTFSRLLPRVTRQDLVKIGSLNSNWRRKAFVSEHHQVIACADAIERAYVLPSPPLASSCSDYSVASDTSTTQLPACSLVCYPPALHSNDKTLLFTILPSKRIFALHVGGGGAPGQSPEVKLPLLPTKISRFPEPLIRFGGYAPKGWLVGEEEVAGPEKTGTAGPTGWGDRVTQSQRKRRQKQQQKKQKQQLQQRLHVSWIYVGPHPVYPCLRGRSGKSASRWASPESSPPLVAPSSSASGCYAPTRQAAIAKEGQAPEKQIRLLCLCLPTIDIEEEGPSSAFRTGREFIDLSSPLDSASLKEHKRDACLLEPVGDSPPHWNDLPAVEEAAVRLGEGHCKFSGTAVSSSSISVSPKPPAHSPNPQRLWPIALCSYSPKATRFQTHFIVCCFLRQGEHVQCARSRLWCKEKRQEKAQRGGIFNEEDVATMKHTQSVVHANDKPISFSLQQHPLAVFVGMVAVGTSEGRILCTPPPRCLVRRCFCGGDCLENLQAQAPPGTWDVQQPVAEASTSESYANDANSCNSSSSSRSNSSSSNSNSNDMSPSMTATRAGHGVSFVEAGSFGVGGGAVDYIELVEGTPWVSREELQDLSSPVYPAQQRDLSWHWTKAFTGLAAPDEQRDRLRLKQSACGGLEAEAIWLFACSKEAGIKIFRFLWSVHDTKKPPGIERPQEGSCGAWVCVLTIRGCCQLISLDLSNGVVALCTPTDSRVCFFCFKHLLPSHIFISRERSNSPEVSPSDLTYFVRCGLPRPQLVPSDGYLPKQHQQQQLVSLLQSPLECSRYELLVAKRPSFLQPLGGLRWVVIDGAVIRVVQLQIREPEVQPIPTEQVHVAMARSPREQLQQLRRSVGKESLMTAWAVKPSAAPVLATTRLCVFSHPRTIYQCAFDGVRRLVTIDLQEILMAWDLQKYTKLFGLDLMAGGGRRYSAGPADSHEEERTSETDAEHLGISSDDMGTGEGGIECGRRSGTVRKGGNGNMGGDDLVCTSSARAARKASRLSLKKHFGSGWVKRQLATQSNPTTVQTVRVYSSYPTLHPHASVHEAFLTRSRPTCSSILPLGSPQLRAKALETAQTQIEPVCEKSKVDVASSEVEGCPGAPEVEAKRQQPEQEHLNVLGCIRETTQAEEDNSAGEEKEDSDKDKGYVRHQSADLGGRSLRLSQSVRKKSGETSLGIYGVRAEQLTDPEAAKALAVCYADDFPPLSSASNISLHAGGSRRNPQAAQTTPLEPRNPSVLSQCPASSSISLASVSTTKASEGILPPAHPEKDINTAASSLPKGPYSACRGERRASSNADLLQGQCQLGKKQLGDPDEAADSERPSFAAVVAAGASSSEAACQRTGWAWGPPDADLLVRLVGEDGWQALQESAAVLGVTVEELYVQQTVQWEQMQRRNCRKTPSEESGELQQQHEMCVPERLFRSASGDSGPDHLLQEMQHEQQKQQQQKQQRAPAVNTAIRQEDGKSSKKGEAACFIPEAETFKNSRVANSPPAVFTSASSSRASPLPAAAGSKYSNSSRLCSTQVASTQTERSMVGLLGRQRSIAPLGPNAQRRHVTAVCISETCLALLFKNHRTWQVWTFSPATEEPASAGVPEGMLY